MVVFLRALLILALAVVAVAPLDAHAAPGAAHHGMSAGHAHGSDHDQAPADERHDSMACCASVSLQCGSAAVIGDGSWTPAELIARDISQARERLARRDGSLPEFEPPPPRS
jgi:hypothetical protein